MHKWAGFLKSQNFGEQNGCFLCSRQISSRFLAFTAIPDYKGIFTTTPGGLAVNLPQLVDYAIFLFLNRKLLVTTNTLLNAIAPAASTGTNKPNAATGIRITL
jgi:hypothetical protein